MRTRRVPRLGLALVLATAAPIAAGCGPTSAGTPTVEKTAVVTAPPPPGKPPIKAGRNPAGPSRPHLFISGDAERY